jgi:YidC/Oxa1 family membrane protein insertase
MDKRTLFYIVSLGLTLFGVNYYFEMQHTQKVEAWRKEQITTPKAKASVPISKTIAPKEAPVQEQQEEVFYALENDYQQLVFSNKSASLVEINLPFETKENTKSVVKEVAFDRTINEIAKKDSLFPLNDYQTADGLKKPKEGGFYPLLRRSLYSPHTGRWNPLPLANSAGYIVSKENSDAPWKMTSISKDTIVFESKNAERLIRKTFSFVTDVDAPYSIDLKIEIEGDAKGLSLTSGIPEVEWISNAAAPEIKYRITKKNRAEVLSLSLPKNSQEIAQSPDWIANSNGFFGFILDPLDKSSKSLIIEKKEGAEALSRLTLLDQLYSKFSPKNLPGYQVLLPLPEQGGTLHYRLFAGPFSSSILSQVDKAFSESKSGYTPDYSASQTMHGYLSVLTAPIAELLKFMLNLFYTTTHSWILAIFLLTIALRIMLYPLNNWSMKSMAKMQAIQPLTAKIQEKYKNDPKKLQLELVSLYREQGINPASGCLPMVIQIPFLIGMFNVLKSSFALRGASVVPGWINDLAAPDTLFTWETPIPFFGNAFHFLPFLNGAMIFLQQKFAAPEPSLVQTEEAKTQAKMMRIMMPVMTTLLFYNFPSGLNIYWIFSSFLAIIQQKITLRRMQAKIEKNMHDVVEKKAKSKKLK